MALFHPSIRVVFMSAAPLMSRQRSLAIATDDHERQRKCVCGCGCGCVCTRAGGGGGGVWSGLCVGVCAVKWWRCVCGCGINFSALGEPHNRNAEVRLNMLSHSKSV